MKREIATRTRRDLASWQKAALGLLALSVAADELGCKDVRTARKVLEEMDVPPVQVGKSKKYEIETLARAIVCARGMC